MSGVGGSRSRLVFGRGFLGWRVVLVTWLVVVGSLVGTAGAWARPPGPTGRPGGPPGRHGRCQVHISRHRIHISKHRVHISKKNYGSLQSAVSAAAPGATLTVRGDCVGTTEIQKGLTIVGSKAKGFGSPTLDGNRAGSVVKVDPSVDPNVVIAIANLTITNGHARCGCRPGLSRPPESRQPPTACWRDRATTALRRGKLIARRLALPEQQRKDVLRGVPCRFKPDTITPLARPPCSAISAARGG
jgi:hypothetical protein